MRRLSVAVLLAVMSAHCILVIGAPREQVEGNSGRGQSDERTVSLTFESSLVRYVFVIEYFDSNSSDVIDLNAAVRIESIF